MGYMTNLLQYHLNTCLFKELSQRISGLTILNRFFLTKYPVDLNSFVFDKKNTSKVVNLY